MPPGMIHEYGHCAGYGDFNDANFKSIMNDTSGMFEQDVTINDKLSDFLAYCLDVKPGNMAPDTNP